MTRTSLLACSLWMAIPAIAAEGQASGTPAETVARFQRDLSNNHLQSIAPMFAPSAQVVVAGNQVGTVPFAGTYTGSDQIDSLLSAWSASLVFQNVTSQYTVTSGNRVVSHFDITAAVVPTGKTCRLEWALAWEFAENNQVTGLHVFYDTYALWLAFQQGGDPIVTDLRPSPEDVTVRPVSYDAAALVSDAYRQFFSGNIAAALPLFSDTTQWVLKGAPSVPEVGVFQGAQGFAQFLYQMFQVEHAQYVAPFPQMYWVIAEGNHVEAYFMEPQMNPSTSAVARTHILQSLALDDSGKLIQMDSFNDSFELYRVFAQ